jgi:predicted ATP-dependent endonuclease of OLD family
MMGDNNMILKKLQIHNFRGYLDEEFIFDNNLNVIIGKNDIGKSSIMEALEIFFNGTSKEAKVKIDITDLNVYAEDKKIILTAAFDVKDESIIIDSTNPTNLSEEYLLNEDGYLLIKKVWDASKEKIGTVQNFITCYYPKIYPNPLVQEKIANLQKIIKGKEKEIVDFSSVNLNTSASIRKALYKNDINTDTEFDNIDIDLSKEDGKNIWSSLEKALPLYFLFKADRSNTDKDAEVQDPMKAATILALGNLQDELEAITVKVREAVDEIGKNTIEKLGEFDNDIAQNLITDLVTKPFDSVYNFTIKDNRGISLNKRGSGIRRLMLLSYFRAEAERDNSQDKNVIYAIEEPETAQHPDFQKSIIESLISLSKKENCQIIITTHTPEIAMMEEDNQLIFIEKDDSGKPINVLDCEVKRRKIIQSLGVLPYAVYKVVVCVEGPNDVSFINTINKNIPEFRDIIDLDAEKIKIIPLQGSNLQSWVNENYFKDSNVKEVHIYDNDVVKYTEKVKSMNGDPRRKGIITKLREMENYIPPKAVEKQFTIEIEENKKDNWMTIDVPKYLVTKAMLNIKDPIEREKVIKAIINSAITRSLSYKDLKEYGVAEEITSWFELIKEMNR